MKPVPINDLTALRQHLANCLLDAGFSDHDVTMFLAGATILGHLQPGGCHWYREHQTRQHLQHLQPSDNVIEHYGKISMSENGRPNPKHRAYKLTPSTSPQQSTITPPLATSPATTPSTSPQQSTITPPLATTPSPSPSTSPQQPAITPELATSPATTTSTSPQQPAITPELATSPATTPSPSPQQPAITPELATSPATTPATTP